MKVHTPSLISVLLLVPMTALAQQAARTTPAPSTLTINGGTDQAPVIQRDGRSYVDVEALARISRGTLGFQANRIVLTLPGPPSVPIAKPAAIPKPAFSKEFVSAAIEELIAIREWHVAIAGTVQKGVPVDNGWASSYRRTADNKLALAVGAASTDSDRKSIPLLQGEFANMQNLSDRFVQLHESVTYVRPDSLENDTLNQKILTCASGIAAMVESSDYADVIACH